MVDPNNNEGLRLKVVQSPSVHHHYYGPVVGRDGVIIMRGGHRGSGRTLHGQSGEDQIHASTAANH